MVVCIVCWQGRDEINTKVSRKGKIMIKIINIFLKLFNRKITEIREINQISLHSISIVEKGGYSINGFVEDECFKYKIIKRKG